MKQTTSDPPFSLLPKKELENLFNCFSYENYKKDTILLVQEITKVEKLYILSKGSAQYYFENNFAKTLKKDLKEGDNFGGISILMNDAVSTRTLKVLSDSKFLTFDAHVFTQICEKYEEFREYFTAEFGKCMLNKSYAGIILRHIRDKEFNLPFFNQPISAMFRPNIATCPIDTPIKTAVEKMCKNSSSAILIRDKDRSIKGLVTDEDLKSKVLAKGFNLQEPVGKIMSSPVIKIPADSQVFDAFLKMNIENKRHLAISSKANDIIGIITAKDLVSSQADSTYLLIKTIQSAQSIEHLKGFHTKLSELLLDPIKNGANPDYITKLITTFSESILDKIIQFTIDEIGEPPCRFVFVIMGSEGRDEQTLISDQDNAIIFEDLPDKADAEKAMQYFTDFAELTCNQLNIAGYKFCDGDNMAKNPKWCQPLNVWKGYFKSWIRSVDPEKVLYSSIFFDFRGAWGDLSLTETLKDYLLESIREWPGILRCLTENSFGFKPPISFFGKFIVEEKGKHKGSFDIKKALMPITDFARIYSLKEGISTTNTLTRLFRLYTKHTLSNKEYLDLIRSYNHMMNLRFLRQITTIMDEEEEPDNYINPANLSSIDQAMLKEIFKITEKLHQKLKVEFIGAT
ncbi:MAG: CBS domain-containing protein [Desulfobacteraceae bacterium]|nr:CBS domain-containing protein [Desulfobacteraceae bacterium]